MPQVPMPDPFVASIAPTTQSAVVRADPNMTAPLNNAIANVAMGLDKWAQVGTDAAVMLKQQRDQAAIIQANATAKQAMTNAQNDLFDPQKYWNMPVSTLPDGTSVNNGQMLTQKYADAWTQDPKNQALVNTLSPGNKASLMADINSMFAGSMIVNTHNANMRSIDLTNHQMENSAVLTNNKGGQAAFEEASKIINASYLSEPEKEQKLIALAQTNAKAQAVSTFNQAFITEDLQGARKLYSDLQSDKYSLDYNGQKILLPLDDKVDLMAKTQQFIKNTQLSWEDRKSVV